MDDGPEVPQAKSIAARRKRQIAKQDRPVYITFNELPLFAADIDIAEAIVGPDPKAIRMLCLQMRDWEKMRMGFPEVSKAFGGRYTRAVLDYFDATYRRRLEPHPLRARHEAPEDGPWYNQANPRPKFPQVKRELTPRTDQAAAPRPSLFKPNVGNRRKPKAPE